MVIMSNIIALILLKYYLSETSLTKKVQSMLSDDYEDQNIPIIQQLPGLLTPGSMGSGSNAFSGSSLLEPGSSSMSAF